MSTREKEAIALGLVTLIVALVVLFALHLSLDHPDSLAFIAVLLFPLIIYVLASGRLQELSGPGGWGAKFQSHAQAAVEIAGIRQDMLPLQALEKGGLEQLSTLVAKLDPDLPNALILNVGEGKHYELRAIQRYLRALLAVGAPSHVVFVDGKTKKFIGSASAHQLLTFLEDPPSANEFMTKLEGKPNQFTGMGFMVTESLAPDDKNVAALRKFVRTHADALVVTSEDARKPVGVVYRDHLLTNLMLTLAS
jgi:hypothetical protein